MFAGKQIAPWTIYDNFNNQGQRPKAEGSKIQEKQPKQLTERELLFMRKLNKQKQDIKFELNKFYLLTVIKQDLSLKQKLQKDRTKRREKVISYETLNLRRTNPQKKNIQLPTIPKNQEFVFESYNPSINQEERMLKKSIQIQRKRDKMKKLTSIIFSNQ